MSKLLKTADLFAGIGGMRKGFERAGFGTVFANDSDANCKITYDLNFPDVPLTVGDIKEISAQPKTMPSFDVLLAGFPCQPFSVAGSKEGFADTNRGNLFFDILKIIKHHQPRVVFLENVKHLKNHDDGRTYPIIKNALQAHGYYVDEMIFNSFEYGGVPQNRERIYIVAFKSSEAYDNFSKPAPKPTPKRVIDILDREVDEKYYHHSGWLYERVKDGVIDKEAVYQWRRVYLRETNRKGICQTLTANMGTGGHNIPLVRDDVGIRKLTPRECARLQGFPENYKLPTPEQLAGGQVYKQIGNSVTVPVVSRIAINIKKALRFDPKLKKKVIEASQQVRRAPRKSKIIV